MKYRLQSHWFYCTRRCRIGKQGKRGIVWFNYYQFARSIDYRRGIEESAQARTAIAKTEDK